MHPLLGGGDGGVMLLLFLAVTTSTAVIVAAFRAGSALDKNAALHKLLVERM